MKAAERRRLLLALVLALSITSVPAGVVYATSTQEKLNQAQEDKKQTQSQLNETKENLAYKICEELDFDVLLTGHQHMSIDGQNVLSIRIKRKKKDALCILLFSFYSFHVYF